MPAAIPRPALRMPVASEFAPRALARDPDLSTLGQMETAGSSLDRLATRAISASSCWTAAMAATRRREKRAALGELEEAAMRGRVVLPARAEPVGRLEALVPIQGRLIRGARASSTA